MADLFKALSGGLARFIYAWLMPSAVAVSVFSVLVLPYAPSGATSIASGRTPAESALSFVLAVLVLSVLFAYASLPIYRFLEGYSMPRWLARPLRRRSLREWHRLHQRYDRAATGGPNWQLGLEAMARYPTDADDVLPTRLGNALRAMEKYGTKLYGLDSQTMWYELQAVAGDNLRRDSEDARAGVDFFVSAIVHLALLAAVSAAVAAWSLRTPPALVAVGALSLIPPAYNQAVLNVDEWRSAVQALVNIGRAPLSAALGLSMPKTFEEERDMWLSMVDLVNYGPDQDYLSVLNRHRGC